MNAVTKAREVAQRAAEALTHAQANAEREQAERDQRNAERRQAYWTGPGLELAKAQPARVRDAQAAFRAAVADGDGAAVLSRYLDYCRVTAEAAAHTSAGYTAAGHIEQPSGRFVSPIHRTSPDARPLDAMLTDAVKALSDEQGRRYATEARKPLTDALEAEDG